MYRENASVGNYTRLTSTMLNAYLAADGSEWKRANAT
jgi:hypothetical protein